MFTSFEPELIEQIATFDSLVVPKDYYLLIEGEYCPGIPLIKKGRVKIIKEEEKSGREIVLYRIHEGEGCIISTASSLLNEPSEAYAITEEETELYLIPIEVSKLWTRKYETWSEFILKTTNQRYVELIRLIHDVNFKNTKQRLIDWLQKNRNENSEILLKQESIAQELGTVREVISRLLKTLETEGQVKVSRGKIWIKV